jgi:cyclophilin family peptidyl-prolyl cis-trans isomerase/HEAT repeat protein
VAGLASARAMDASLAAVTLEDPDAEVRRMTLAGLGIGDETSAGADLILRHLEDDAPSVRYEALRIYGGWLLPTRGCAAVLRALSDVPHIRFLAIDILGQGCPADGATVDSVLSSLVAASPKKDGDWHAAAHALVSMARLHHQDAQAAIPSLAASDVWQVRMYAARAAAIDPHLATLYRLARDPNANVREAALRGLSEAAGHVADSLYVAALTRDDYQLLLTAANALEGSPAPGEAVGPLLEALRRTTAQQRETSRDARRALLERIGELGSVAGTAGVRLYLKDFDPAIAMLAAETLEGWTGTPHAAKPELLPRAPFPSLAELQRLDGALVTVHMRRGGRFTMRLFPFEAPTNAERFARLARQGYFDGLTFHRVVPNFVIQGGSPGANEYMGDGPFTRDELTSRSHLRGTVGVSTRGRDTGDGQIFVNLVDNVRLDHNYTIFGEVIDGMEVVDAVLEGGVIDRIEIVER